MILLTLFERVTSGALALASMRPEGFITKKRTLFGSAQEFAMQRIFRMIIDVMKPAAMNVR